MKILFVCVGNSARSQMAEALFNSMAPEGMLAISAGTEPAPRVSSRAIEVMKELGIDIGSNKPKLLTPEMVREAKKVITMGCLDRESCPVFLIEEKEKLEDWALEDPKDKDIEVARRVRDEIKKRVEELIEELRSSSSK